MAGELLWIKLLCPTGKRLLTRRRTDDRSVGLERGTATEGERERDIRRRREERSGGEDRRSVSDNLSEDHRKEDLVRRPTVSLDQKGHDFWSQERASEQRGPPSDGKGSRGYGGEKERERENAA